MVGVQWLTPFAHGWGIEVNLCASRWGTEVNQGPGQRHPPAHTGASVPQGGKSIRGLVMILILEE